MVAFFCVFKWTCTVFVDIILDREGRVLFVGQIGSLLCQRSCEGLLLVLRAALLRKWLTCLDVRGGLLQLCLHVDAYFCESEQDCCMGDDFMRDDR
jgi:hypothetical protein